VQREGDSHSVRVTAERPETLALLQRDRHELDRGLAEAGLRVDSAGIDFSLETPAGSGSFGQEPGTGQRGDSRGHAGGTARLPAPEREAPPPRVLRSLLDLNI
jgi:flagellar hook-length control protein FliK